MKSTLITPDYTGYCICNIAGTIAQSYGLTHDRVLPSSIQQNRAFDRPKKILFVLDACGKQSIDQNIERLPELQALHQSGSPYVLDSVTHSTTPVALAAIHTGRTPQESGAAEFIQYREDVKKRINPILFSIEGQPSGSLLQTHLRIEDLYPHPPIYPFLKENGIACHQIIPQDYVGSAFNTRMGEGCEIKGYATHQELVAQASSILNATAEPTYVVVYMPDVDAVGHAKGPGSAEHTGAIAAVSRTLTDFLKVLSAEARKDTTVMITADHDQVAVDPDKMFYLDDFPLYRKALKKDSNGPILPTGAPDSLILHLEPQYVDEVYGSLTDHLEDRALVIKTEEAMQKGFFGIGDYGPYAQETRGDVLVLGLSTDAHTFWRFNGQPFSQRGIHGGMSEETMKVYFMVFEANNY